MVPLFLLIPNVVLMHFCFVGPVTGCVAALKEIIAALFIRGSGIEIDGLLKHFHHTFQGVEQEDADAFYLAILHRLEVSL